MDTQNEQSVGQTHEKGQSQGVAAVSAGSAIRDEQAIIDRMCGKCVLLWACSQRIWRTCLERERAEADMLAALTPGCANGTVVAGRPQPVELHVISPNGSHEPRGGQS